MDQQPPRELIPRTWTDRASVSPLPRKVAVLLADDHDGWRSGLRLMLEDTEFEVVGEAASCRETLEAVRRVRPEITLLDSRLAGGDGLDILGALKAEHTRMAVVMLTTYVNPAFVARSVSEGAAGYLLKGITRDDLIYALRVVANGARILMV